MYEAALADPQSLLKIVEEEDDACQIAGYQYASQYAWARKTGQDKYDFPYSRTSTLPDEPSGENWEEEDLPRRFPKLWRQFG